MLQPAGRRGSAGWWVAAGVVALAPWLDDSRRWPVWFGVLTVALGLALGLAALRPRALARLDGPTRWLAIGVALLIGLAALQVLPLGGALAWLSPTTVEARRPFLLDGVGPTCLSLDPHLTRVGGLAWAGAAVVALLAARAGPPRLLCGLLVAGAVLQVVVALPQVGAAARARGTFVSPNNLAALLFMLFPVALALGGVGQRVRPTGWRRWLPLAAAAVLGLGVVASRSRSGAVGAAVAVGVFVALSGAARGRRATLALALGLLLLVAGADVTLGRFDRLVAGEETDRLAWWAIGWQLFLRFPLLGAGLRSHAALTPELLADPRLLDATHNDYINLLADCGLVGGALALGAVAAWVMAVRRGLARLPRGGARRALLAASAAAAAGMAAASVVEFGLQVAPVLWTFAALAGIAAGGDPAVDAGPGPARSWTRATRQEVVADGPGRADARVINALGGALAFAAVVLAFHGARLAVARDALGRALDARSPMELRRGRFLRASRLWPAHGRTDVEWGRALRAAGDLPTARLVLARACFKAPRDPWAHLELASVLAAPEPRRERLAAARRLAPHDPGVRLEAGRQALALGRLPGVTPAARAADRDLALADLRAAVAGRVALLDDAVAALLAQPYVGVADFEALLEGAHPDRRRRCVVALADHSPGPARRLLEPLLGPGADARDVARAAGLDLRLGRAERARALWLEAARTHARPGDLLRVAARDLSAHGRRDLAEALLGEAVEARPDAAALWRELGRLHLATRRPAEARQALERAVDLDPRVGGLELGDAFLAEGRADSALLAWRRALGATADRRERADLQHRIARALAARGDEVGAREAARAALAVDPAHAGARELLLRLRAR
ncbi:MAG: O-antigen ligase family protein [Planctomycetes bacterium]|nr:O-antigen ligase family protein [Planctomycetota bacterium]